VRRGTLVVGFHVDDIVMVGSKHDIDEFISQLKEHLSIKDNLIMNEFLGVDIEWDKQGVMISQHGLIKKLISVMEKYITKNYEYSTPATPGVGIVPLKDDEEGMSGVLQAIFRSSIGSFLFLERYTRPDISNAVRELSKVSAKGSDYHFDQLVRLVVYLRKTLDHKLKIFPNKEHRKWVLDSYSDSDWAGDVADRKSVTGWIVRLNGAVICWGSRKQTLTSLSSCEAEYVAVSEIAKEVLFAKTIIEFIERVEIDLPIIINCDNEGAIFLSRNQESRKTKYLDTRIHFVRDFVEDGIIMVKFVRSDENLADPYTKNVNQRSLIKNYPYIAS